MQTIISPSQYCEGPRHFSGYCMCISDATLKDVKTLRGLKLNHHNVSCLVTVVVTPAMWWTVTAGKRASNMSTGATEGRICFSVSTDRTGCFVLLWVVLLVCPSSVRSNPPKAEDVVNIWGLLILLSCSRANFPCDSCLFHFYDWLRIWPRHIPAPWTGLFQTSLPPCPWWWMCLNHCSAEADAHLTREIERKIMIWHLRHLSHQVARGRCNCHFYFSWLIIF